MFTRLFDPRKFLRQVFGSEAFVLVCRSRSLAFEQVVGFAMRDDDYRRWQEALGKLPESEQARIELELAQVNDMACPDAVGQLVAAAPESELPADSVPGEAALALHFFLHHSSLFQEVFLHQEIAEVDAWRTVNVPPGIVLHDLARCQAALAASLKDFFRVREGTGRFCAVDAYVLAGSYCFIAYLSDRLHLFDVFTEEGTHTTKAARPAFAVLFVYRPADGRLLLKTRRRASDKILDLFQRFARVVLEVELDERCLAPAFRLDLFKRRFDPLPDREDMGMVTVWALHLAYPARAGRRRLNMETLAGDGQFAILELLEEHGGRAGVLDQLQVLYVELQVPLRVEGGSKNHVIRLWPDRCSLNQTPLGERLFSCLRRWGVAYGG